MNGEHDHDERYAQRADLTDLRDAVGRVERQVAAHAEEAASHVTDTAAALLDLHDRVAALEAAGTTTPTPPTEPPTTEPTTSRVSTGTFTTHAGWYQGNNPKWVDLIAAETNTRPRFCKYHSAGNNEPLSKSMATLAGYVKDPEYVLGPIGLKYIPVFMTHTYSDHDQGHGRPDRDPMAQAVAFGQVLDGDEDRQLDRMVDTFEAALKGHNVTDRHEIIHCQPNHEASGDWQGHSFYPGQEHLYWDVWQYVHDHVSRGLANRGIDAGRVIWDWNNPGSGNWNGCDIIGTYRGHEISPVTGHRYADTHSTNPYFKQATRQDHVRSGGPFGPNDIDNRIRPDRVAAVWDRIINNPRTKNGAHTFGVMDQIAFAAQQGVPWGTGEWAPGTGWPDPRNTFSERAKWSHDTPEFVTLFAELVDTVAASESGVWGVNGFMAEGSTGVRMKHLPRSYQALKDYYAGVRA